MVQMVKDPMAAVTPISVLVAVPRGRLDMIQCAALHLCNGDLHWFSYDPAKVLS